MITLDELIQNIQISLTEKRRRETVSIEDIQAVLSEAGIADLLRREDKASVSGRLTLRQIRISGQKQIESGNQVPLSYHRLLEPGLNGWVAGNSTGKSTILKTILWAIIGVEPDFKPDVRAWLEDVAVEVEIVDDGIYTVRYFPKADKTKVSGGIFAGDLAFVLNNASTVSPIESFSNQNDMSKRLANFFGKRLGYVPLEWAFWKKDSVDVKQDTVSWDIYSQALFISADNYSDYLFPQRGLYKHHQKTLGMYLGFDLLEAVSQAQVKHQRAKNDYEIQKRKVKDDAIRVAEQLESTRRELQQVEKQVQQIDENASIFADVDYANQVGQQISQSLARKVSLEELQEEQQQLEREIQEQLNQMRRSSQMLKESIEFKYVLNNLEVERCPHCETNVSLLQIEHEIATKHCRLCGSELRSVTSTDEQEAMLRNTERKIQDSQRELRRIRKEIANNELREVQQEIEIHRGEFKDLSHQAQAGFSITLRSLIERLGYLKGRIDHLEEMTEEKQHERIRRLEMRQDILYETLLQLQSSITRQYEVILDKLKEEVFALAKQFGVKNLEEVYFNPSFDMFVRQSNKSLRFEDMEAGERLRLKVAFHLALLDLRIAHGVGRHPTFLVIDAPGGAEMDERNFDAILHSLTEFQERLQGQAQILLASTKEELLEIIDDAQVEHRREKETLF